MPDTAALLTTLITYATQYGLRLLGVLFVLFVAAKMAKWAGRTITSRLEARQFDLALSRFFGSLVRWGILVGAVLGCLGAFGIQTTSFAAVIGAAGLAIGLAFQGTLSNFAAGVMLLVFKPFKIGDFVKTAGQLGTIVDIGLFTTSLDTLDNRRIIIPNTEIAGKTLENISHNGTRRVDINVGIAYETDIKQSRTLLEAAMAKVEGKLDDEPNQVMLLALGSSSVDWQVRVWCRAEDYWGVWEATIEAIKSELDEAGVSIPFPQMDVHLDREKAA